MVASVNSVIVAANTLSMLGGGGLSAGEFFAVALGIPFIILVLFIIGRAYLDIKNGSYFNTLPLMAAQPWYSLSLILRGTCNNTPRGLKPRRRF